MSLNHALEEKILVLAETGSNCAAWTERQNHGNLLVIAQLPDEAGLVFSERSTGRVNRLSSGEWRPRLALIAFGPDCEGSTLNSRIAMLRALLTALAAEDGELIVSVDAHFPRRCVQEARALVQTLLESSPTIRVSMDLFEERSAQQRSSNSPLPQRRAASSQSVAA